MITDQEAFEVTVSRGVQVIVRPMIDATELLSTFSQSVKAALRSKPDHDGRRARSLAEKPCTAEILPTFRMPATQKDRIGHKYMAAVSHPMPMITMTSQRPPSCRVR